MKNQVKFKIGEIEFEAAGSSEIIEREREYFLNNILPVAVDSIRITKQINATPVYPETFESNNVSFPEQEKSVQSIENISKTTIPYAEEDVSRTNLATFLTEFGDVTEADFILISAYYDEKRNHVESFSVENVKNYYEEARRPKYSNNSALLNQLAKKSLIIEKKPNEKTSRKFYILSKLGIDYIENFEKKEVLTKPRGTAGKKKSKTLKSNYSNINADVLNLDKYPSMESLKTFKDKMMLALYIITEEGKGEFFSLNDVNYIMINIFGVSSNTSNISNVFRRNKTWFHSEEIDGNLKKKLLQNGKKYVNSFLHTIEV